MHSKRVGISYLDQIGREQVSGQVHEGVGSGHIAGLASLKNKKVDDDDDDRKLFFTKKRSKNEWVGIDCAPPEIKGKKTLCTTFLG